MSSPRCGSAKQKRHGSILVALGHAVVAAAVGKEKENQIRAPTEKELAEPTKASVWGNVPTAISTPSSQPHDHVGGCSSASGGKSRFHIDDARHQMERHRRQRYEPKSERTADRRFSDAMLRDHDDEREQFQVLRGAVGR